MRLSRETHQQLESFFREYFADENLNLPEIQIFCRNIAGFLTKTLKIHGITFGRFIFIRPDILRNTDKRLSISKELLAHEAAHVLQYKQLGWLRFFYTYLKAYWKNLKIRKNWDLYSRSESYLQIPHEVEARECGAAFVQWTKKNKRGN